MRTYISLLIAGILAVLSSSCRAQQPASEPQADYKPTATIKEIMDSMVDPNADYVWNSVATILTEKETIERAPKTPQEWAELRRHAVTLLEATNLLVMPGRKVAASGDKSENPGIELEPEKMEALINQDRKSFIDLAHALHDTMIPVIAAIDKKDPQELESLGDSIDRACENCHLKYWYPNEAKPQ